MCCKQLFIFYCLFDVCAAGRLSKLIRLGFGMEKYAFVIPAANLLQLFASSMLSICLWLFAIYLPLVSDLTFCLFAL